MTTLFLSNLRSKRSMARVLFGWFMLFSLVLQTTAFSPLIASADVVVDVTHTDGTVNQYTVQTTPDDVHVAYTMGANEAGAGKPTLSALSGILASLNTVLDDAKATAAANCSGSSASASASANATGDVTVNGVTASASASANANADCTGSGTASFAYAYSHSSVTITTGGNPPAETNTKPVINVIGANTITLTQGTAYTDLGANATDAEDCVGLSQATCNVALHLTATGVVNTAVVAVYTITYTAVDSKGLTADPKTRTVNVTATPAVCTLPTDTVLIMDRSASMKFDGTNPDQPLTKAKDAAKGYIDTLSATVDHVGVVSFSDTATRDMSLTSDFVAAKNSISALVALGNTNLSSALTTGTTELDTNGRANTKHVMILLSDGKPYPDTIAENTAVLNAAAAAKVKGYTIYTIGLGTGVDPVLMSAIASTQANYYYAPTAVDLASIYNTISATECARVPATIAGHKFNDVNGNGQLSQGEAGLSGWTITMSSTLPAVVGIRTVTTNASGEYLFNDVAAGSYRVCEVNQTGWNQIAPVGGCYTLDVQDGINYVSKDFFNKLSSVVPPTACTLDIVSDASTLIDGGANAVATYAANTVWTASIPGATWIWKSFNVANPAVNDTTNFTKNFTLTDPIASAVVTLAADNNFSFGVNGTVVGSDNSGINFATAKTFDVGSKLHTGVNAANFSVTNIGLVGSTPTSNPAGLLYKIHVVYNKTGCNTPPPVNQIPVITRIGDETMTVHINTVFTDPGATAYDAEDKDITKNIATTSTVNMSTVGNYKITYNVTDSAGAPAVEVVRYVKVVSACSDGIDNDGDKLIDMRDSGCTTPNDDNENTPPVIALLGVTPMSVVIGSPFTDPGANATDTEDCLTLSQSACNTALHLIATGVVNTAIVGPYTIKYNAVDSTGAPAAEVVRTVNVTQGGGSANQPPVITLIGGDMNVHINSLFTDPGANATDAEDCVGLTQTACNTKLKLTATGTVDTHNVGNYTITYNATDTQGLPAQPKTRLVKVVSACSDGIDNDGDTLIDMVDPGCTTPNGDSENTKPVITLIGDTVMQLLIGTAFVDPGANATDTEDCIGLNQSACNTALHLTATGTVKSSVLGAYPITYTAIDSQLASATPVIRTVNVYQNSTPGCTTNCGGGSSTFDYYGCTNPLATNYNRLANKDDGMCQIPGGGGGGGTVSLSIYNEKLEVTGTTTVTITWNTNINSDSRVVYGLDSVSTLGAATYYGYPLTTATDTMQTTTHTMVVSGIPSAIATYFRPVSSNGNQTVTGIELKRTPAITVGGYCEYLKEYMRIGLNNNPTEVLKLQLFLKNFEGFTTIPTSGFFDQETDADVRAFQDRYTADVLTPWDLPGNTGYVYYTTKKKINEIYCQRAFPLDATQLAEIADFRELIKRLGQQTNVNVNTVLPIVGVNTTGNEGAVAGASTVKNPNNSLTVNSSTTTTPVATTSVNGGRIALADLLAISPSLGGSLSGTDTVSTNGVTTTAGLAKGDALVKQNFLQATIGSISDMTNISEKAVLFILFLLLIALIVAGFFGRKYVLARASDNEMVV